jgi:hypothetical protein
MSFGLDVKRFGAKVEQRIRDVADRSTQLAYESIVQGSPITGAPGQPVDTGNLKASWQIVEGPLRNEITTNVVYAPQIEDGSRAGRALVLRSQVGGFHSVMLTRVSWGRIVEQATKEVGNG